MMLLSTVFNNGASFLAHIGGFPVFQLMTVRGLMIGTICLMIIGWNSSMRAEHGFLGPKRLRKQLISLGLLGWVIASCSFYAVTHLPFSDSIAISFTSPVFVAISCFIFLKEPFTRKDVVMTLMCFIGVILVTKPLFIFPSSMNVKDEYPDYTYGLIAQLVSAFLISIYAVMTRRMSALNPHTLNIYFGFISGLMSLPLAILFTSSSDHTPIDYLFLLIMGVSSFLGGWLWTVAMQSSKGGPVMRINYIQIIYSFFLSAVVAKEEVSALSIVGSLFIASTTIYQVLLSLINYIKAKQAISLSTNSAIELQKLETTIAADSDT